MDSPQAGLVFRIDSDDFEPEPEPSISFIGKMCIGCTKKTKSMMSVLPLAFRKKTYVKLQF